MIFHGEEKLGGRPVTNQETIDFAQYLNVCNLIELKYIGSTYIWWNGRIEEESIFKRLDRIVINQEFVQLLLNGEVHHLDRQESDHSHMHVIYKNDKEVHAKPFSLLNFWVNHPKFKEVI